MTTDRVGFILGAGAHCPFNFPSGEDLKTRVGTLLDDWPGNMADEYRQAKGAILDCGVSIDRFLAENRPLNDLIRPLIAKCLLEQERQSADLPMSDWLGYLWPSLQGKSAKTLSKRFVFVTFNYDRTLEYRMARSCAALWGMPLIEACNRMDSFGVYHVYGSLGGIGTDANDYVEYGRRECFGECWRRIKIIGEHDSRVTDEIHDILGSVSHIFMLGCGFHAENMSLLDLGRLRDRFKISITASCRGLTSAERAYVMEKFPYLALHEHTHRTALEVLRHDGQFQKLR